MPASIFNGNFIKLLKDNLKFKNGKTITTDDSSDPTSSAVDADQGSLLLRNGTAEIYSKSDNGLTTNWEKVAFSSDLTGFVTGPNSSTNTAIAVYDDTTGKLLRNSGVLIDASDNVTIPGDLTVNGTLTSINSTNLEVTDQNITLNNGGNDASSIGAGITIERTTNNGSILFDDTATSKFKVGYAGSEIEIVDLSSSQTMTGKSIDADSNTITNIDNGEIKAAAGIEMTKMEALTASRVPQLSASGFIEASTITNTELSYLSGTSSNLQTQIDGKVDSFSATTDNVLMRTDGTTGDIQESTVSLSDTGDFTGVNTLQTTSVEVNSVGITTHTTNTNLTISANGTGEVNMATSRVNIGQSRISMGGASELQFFRPPANTQAAIEALSNQQGAIYFANDINRFIANNGSGYFFLGRDLDISSITSNTSATDGKTYLTDTTGGAVTITLPTPENNGFVSVVDSGGDANNNNITVARNGSESIQGVAADYVIDSNRASLNFVSDGTNWFIK